MSDVARDLNNQQWYSTPNHSDLSKLGTAPVGELPSCEGRFPGSQERTNGFGDGVQLHQTFVIHIEHWAWKEGIGKTGVFAADKMGMSLALVVELKLELS